jgi:hypothetical protein
LLIFLQILHGTWRNASHGNSRMFGRIHSCVPKALTGKISTVIESCEIPMFFHHSKGGIIFKCEQREYMEAMIYIYVCVVVEYIYTTHTHTSIYFSSISRKTKAILLSPHKAIKHAICYSFFHAFSLHRWSE